MARSMCDLCRIETETVVVVPFCKYVPHGLLSEVRNHPGYDKGHVECTDACDPQEMTYEAFVAAVGGEKLPSMALNRCAICSCAKQQ